MTELISGVAGRLTSTVKQDTVKADQENRLRLVKSEATGQTSATDTVELSAVAQQDLSRAEFDQAKVEQIKQALADGTYPIDPRRIAESFASIEKLL
ncbi:MAG: flagellar biosynthesis anti-sigma factor FlgM [Litorivicinaceae bacterium]